MSGVCGRYGCSQPAAWVIKQPYDRDIYRCHEHVAQTAEIHGKFTNRQTAGVRVEALR